MKHYSHQRNKETLIVVANKLQEICNDVTFVGGSILGFLITDSLAPEVRFTVDVDCIVNIVTHSDYYKLSKKLREKGLKEIMTNGHPLCRWDCDGILVDIIPTDKKILGFSNSWYQESILYAIIQTLNVNTQIKIISPDYFIATKLEAFHNRGKNDYFASHDLEDVISLIDGRPEIIDDFLHSTKNIKLFISKVFTDLLDNKNFIQSLPGHLNYGSETDDRKKIVLNRMSHIANTANLFIPSPEEK